MAGISQWQPDSGNSPIQFGMNVDNAPANTAAVTRLRSKMGKQKIVPTVQLFKLSYAPSAELRLIRRVLQKRCRNTMYTFSDNRASLDVAIDA